MIFLLYKLYFLSPYTNPTPKPSLTENVLHVLMQNITILMQNIKKKKKKYVIKFFNYRKTRSVIFHVK